MHKKILSAAIAIALLASPVIASAQTVTASSTTNASKIAALEQLVATLTQELQQLLAARSGSGPNQSSSSTTTTATITQSLGQTSSLGSTDTAPQPFVLNWSSTNAVSCTVAKSNPSGTMVNVWATGTSGQLTPSFPIIGTYHIWIDCVGSNASVHQDLYHIVTQATTSYIPQTPTMSLSATAHNVQVGTPVTINANFVPTSGDTVTSNGINWIQPGASEVSATNSGVAYGTTLTNPLTFTFTPTAPGLYVFKPVVMTSQYPNAATAASSTWLTVRVAGATPTTPSNVSAALTQSLAQTTSQGSTDTAPQTFKLNWTSTNATSCTLSKSSPLGVSTNAWSSGTSGQLTPSFPIIGTYHIWIDCTGPGGTAHQDLYHVVGGVTNTSIPGLPTAVNATCANYTASFSWNAPSGATSYILDQNDPNVGYTWPAQTLTSPSFSMSNLHSPSYNWSVSACNSNGCSDSVSGNVFSCGPPPPLPAPPTSLNATCANHDASFSWAGVSGATYFILNRQDTYPTTSYTWAPLPLTDNDFSVNGLYSSSYVWSVEACNSSGCSAPTSGNGFSCVAPTSIPSTPTIMSASCDNTTYAGEWVAHFSWAPVEGADYYTWIMAGLSGDSYYGYPGTIYGTNTAMPGLIAGASYQWHLLACNALGCSNVGVGPNVTCK